MYQKKFVLNIQLNDFVVKYFDKSPRDYVSILKSSMSKIALTLSAKIYELKSSIMHWDVS